MSATTRVLPYGSWPTPITSEVVVADAVRLAEVRVDGDSVIWTESRPAERGRTALVRRSADGGLTELLGESDNARTAVHEYGGGAWWAGAGVVWFTQWSDQRLYRRDPDTGDAQPLTPEPAEPRGDRYADGVLSPDGEWIVCVREHHPRGGGPRDVRNEIVRLAAHEPSVPEALVSGPDFVSDPRFSHDGERLCWLEWDHPNMPWDETRLQVRDQGSGTTMLTAGGPGRSVSEPQWHPDGSLTFIGDRAGWWNLYRWHPDGDVEPVVEIEAEIGVPQWVFGTARYAVLGDGRVVFARWRNGFDGLGVRTVDGTVADLGLPFCSIRNIRAASEDTVVVVGASPTEEASVLRLTFGDGPELARVETLRGARQVSKLGVPANYISAPEPVELSSAGDREAHGLLYRPLNPECDGPPDERPPLLIEIHGGPTSSASPELDLSLQYWTSRGFAFLDLNYGGSTGYGRAYRDLLRGSWGVVDVEDAIAAARWVAREGLADPERICIRGGSAGGFTTLAVLARSETPFAAGADYFGIADLEPFEHETHKFESWYLDSLIGPFPEERALYRERSPITRIDEFTRPLIVLQGLEDEVVPPNQATMIVEALEAKGIPVAYLLFEGEQHGFRRAENIRRSLDGELSFYAQIFGFELPSAEGIEPVEIRALQAP
jgi:dipeptidyl aminopeptidase/acylaminoacyl peptidase